MKITAAERIELLCNTVPARLLEIDESAFSAKPAPDKWSKKEITGHLIDSAINNYMRFVRGQFEHEPVIFYDQDKWNEFGYYQKIEQTQIIDLWRSLNLQIAALVRNIPDENLSRTCRGKDGKTLTIDFLIDDYVGHLEHHLGQMGEC